MQSVNYSKNNKKNHSVVATLLVVIIQLSQYEDYDETSIHSHFGGTSSS